MAETRETNMVIRMDAVDYMDDFVFFPPGHIFTADQYYHIYKKLHELPDDESNMVAAKAVDGLRVFKYLGLTIGPNWIRDPKAKVAGHRVNK